MSTSASNSVSALPKWHSSYKGSGSPPPEHVVATVVALMTKLTCPSEYAVIAIAALFKIVIGVFGVVGAGRIFALIPIILMQLIITLIRDVRREYRQRAASLSEYLDSLAGDFPQEKPQSAARRCPSHHPLEVITAAPRSTHAPQKVTEIRFNLSTAFVVSIELADGSSQRRPLSLLNHLTGPYAIVPVPARAGVVPQILHRGVEPCKFEEGYVCDV